MHPTVQALLALHDTNQQRLIFARERKAREAKLAKVKAAAAKAEAAAATAAAEVDSVGALQRQYTADLARCEALIGEQRAKQMEAKTNKEYLTAINAIEQAKAEMKVRAESLRQLGERIAGLEAAAAAAAAVAATANQAVATVEAEISAAGARLSTEGELDRIYQEQRDSVDPKFLEAYERLTGAGKSPLMKVDAQTRATPLGNRVSTNQLETLRLGGLVTDAHSAAILYVDE